MLHDSGGSQPTDKLGHHAPASAFGRILLLLLMAAAGAQSPTALAGERRATAPPSASPTTQGSVHRIALISDPHVSRGPIGDVYVRHFRQVIEEVNAAGVEAALLAGDLTQSGLPAEMDQFKELVTHINAKVCYVPGNHDVGNKLSSGQKSIVAEARLKTYQEHLGPIYFAQEVVAGVKVVGICSSLLGSGLPQEMEQWSFIEKELMGRKGQSVILLTHYPPFVRKVDEVDEYYNMNQQPRGRLLATMEAAGAQTILSGHLHRPNEYQVGKVHVIGAPAVSFGLPRGKQREGWILVTIDAAGKCSGELRYLPAEAARPEGK